MYRSVFRFWLGGLSVALMVSLCGCTQQKQMHEQDDESTIDEQLQKLGEELMAGKVGSIVALDPTTGEVLCMVSSPVDSARQFNRCIQGQYPPGEVFRVAHELVLLSEGKTIDGDFREGFLDMMSPPKYGSIQGSLTKWRDYMVSMGLGRQLGIDLPNEKRGVIPTADYYDKAYRGQWDGQTIMDDAIGQGVLSVTPLQLANLCATIANRGSFFVPHVVKSEGGQDTTFTTRHRTMVTEEAYAAVIKEMRTSVMSGDCKEIESFHIEACGVSGTALSKGKPHSVFMGFAPMDHPKIAIAVYVENSDSDIHDAVPIGGLLMEKYLNPSEWFDFEKPVDLSELPQITEEETYLFEDMSFVLRIPEYALSPQPFLANAEDFYNSCAILWNIYSNYEVWYRRHSMYQLRDDHEVRKTIQKMDVDIIRDKDLRSATQNYKDSMRLLMTGVLDEEGVSASDLIEPLSHVIKRKTYRLYDDEKRFAMSLDSLTDVAEGMVMDKFRKYQDADEQNQLKVILHELSTCRNFDEQCSLWRNWANCEKSLIEDEWLVGVGMLLMQSGNYSPILHRVWITWRALCQSRYYGVSRDSTIPNPYYNEIRKRCFITCLKHLESHPEDIYAMNCALVLGSRSNLNRYGQNLFGNEAVIEESIMLPMRYPSSDNDAEVKGEE